MTAEETVQLFEMLGLMIKGSIAECHEREEIKQLVLSQKRQIDELSGLVDSLTVMVAKLVQQQNTEEVAA